MASPHEEGSQEFWRELWTTEGADIWQEEGVSKSLLKHKDIILAGKKEARVFLPLCGKAHELKWFLDLGHSVVGVEWVEECVRDYFVENDLQMEEDICPVTKCKIIQTPDHRLRIFICNIFDFRRECTGLFDIVWDRSGFTAMKEDDRAKYASVLKSLLAPGFSYGMWTVVYDAPWYKGPPRSADEATLREYFGDVARVAKIDSYVIEKAAFLDGAGPVYCYVWIMSA
ncbi:thiopurine S-methyltransferase-like [Haemaphysalis longicornis]